MPIDNPQAGVTYVNADQLVQNFRDHMDGFAPEARRQYDEPAFRNLQALRFIGQHMILLQTISCIQICSGKK